jgi:hypothetical protein
LNDNHLIADTIRGIDAAKDKKKEASKNANVR